ncbi:hypothetical protein AB835_06690 [Candidatus Endobugula sertula]|uniref:Indolepyruvate oxidoreductase subunit IorA n=1 Tax=Candidatus Endobugula sertula TaxID=62101 RepID=A0A1D2QQF9_9GAMM|nr:hypothetical protein AB835_06690 [Candidatus Endobugula sertula]
MKRDILLGNEAIGLGLIKYGINVITSYPGSPVSEIIAGVKRFKKYFASQNYIEWSTNEKVAYEVSLAASWSGLRSAVVMKQVGLNVAADPFFSSAYTGVKGALLIISGDDLGPTSSQTEQDSRMMALVAHIPVFDPCSPSDALDMIPEAIEVSEKYQTPVLIRPTLRLCHSIQDIAIPDNIDAISSTTQFIKKPSHWAATPQLRYQLRKELNKKINDIADRFEFKDDSQINKATGPNIIVNSMSDFGVLTSGSTYNVVKQVMDEFSLNFSVLRLATPYPLPAKSVRHFVESFKKVLVLEEPGPCIETQLVDRTTVLGRLNGYVPNAGEITPDILLQIFVQLDIIEHDKINQPQLHEPALPSEALKGPSLCPGCSHRSVFYSLKKTFGENAIYPSDFGCYTLGKNIGTVDTFLDMGASISMAAGFFHSCRINNDNRPIIATIGDSTFVHAGIPALINAVHTNARFILLILDNRVTAMTGFQPTAAVTELADESEKGTIVNIDALVTACGIQHIERVDPYYQKEFDEALSRAYEHTYISDTNVSVIIADHPCTLKKPKVEKNGRIEIAPDCDACGSCYKGFECPSLSLNLKTGKAQVNYETYVECGQCLIACERGYISQITNDNNRPEVRAIKLIE